MAKDFFQRFFKQKGCALMGYHRRLSQVLPETGRVLDLGCGDHTQLGRYRASEREIWGTDLLVHRKLPSQRWFRQMKHAELLPFPDEHFHIVASSWVLEHVVRPANLFTEVSRVLRPGGWFVAITPNANHYVTWIIRLIGLLPHETTQMLASRLYGRAQHDTFPTYYRLNSVPQIRYLALAAGLHLAKIELFATPHYFSFWEPLRRTAVICDWLLDCLRPGLGRVHMVVSLQKPAVHRADAPARAASETTGHRFAA